MNAYKPEHTKAPQEIFDLLLDHFRGPIMVMGWRQTQLGDWVCTFYSGSTSMVAHIEREELDSNIDNSMR